MTTHPSYLNAGNAGPFTLDGTRCFRVGDEKAVVIDPGPDVDTHVRARRVLLTHRHGDHAGAARAVAAALDAEVWGPEGIDGVDRVLRDGDEVETDQGVLRAVHTPGHTVEHLCFHWPARRALFAGDLLLGRGNTTWVAEYPGCVSDYLSSLQKVRELDLAVVYPAHGPPLEDVSAALDLFEAHRRRRIDQVRRAMETHPDAEDEALLRVVYGESVPRGMERAALRSLSALVDFVRAEEGLRGDAG